MKKRPSLKDIAKKLNISVTTVSFVLNGKGKEKKISDEVIKKVLAYTESINYRPNSVAKSLRTGKTNILVFMVEDISNYFFSKIARIIEDLAYEKGYKVLFCSNDNEDERSGELIQLFTGRQVDGFIISPSPGIENEIDNLIKNKVPVVLFDRYFEGLETDVVMINNMEAAFKATRHLIENGYKKIGFITTDSVQNQMLGREDGYIKAVKDEKLPTGILKISFDDIKKDKARINIREFIKEQKLDAVFFATNYLTRTGLEVIKENRHSELSELGIVTFDDNELFKINTPSITAVAQPLDQIGNSLMDSIFSIIENKEHEPSKKILDTSLIIRDSSQPRK